MLATTSAEVPIWFRSNQDELFGIVYLPTERNGIAVLLIQGGGTGATPHTNRMFVRLSRTLANRGFVVMRMDYHGVGESTGVRTHVRLNEPFVDDIEAALECLSSHQEHGAVIVGTCFGSRGAVTVAGTNQMVRALAMLVPPIFDNTSHHNDIDFNPDDARPKDLTFFQRAVLSVSSRGRPWLRRVGIRYGRAGASDHFLKTFDAAMQRQIPTLVIYGTADSYFRIWQRALNGRLGALVRRASDSLSVRVLEGKVQGYPTVSIQDDVLTAVEQWLAEMVAPMLRSQGELSGVRLD